MLQNNRGNTYLENLIAVSILAIAILAISSTQIRAIQLNRSAVYRTQAVLLAHQFSATLSSRTLAQNTRLSPRLPPEWRKSIATTLPNGQAKVVQTHGVNSVLVRIMVAWGNTANAILQQNCAPDKATSISQFRRNSYLTGCFYLVVRQLK